ncbi:redoxin family protein [Mucilaginibacter daejeonensis]|uniref:redoxin family protein n=1 Tax=Mucilaginibacter daejeonensis TaxID=398049 RepID=UPI001D178E45|nr:redoxin family protein [Mucilaginibacter daejeonensis]UEG51807.1 redoxin family protein [Mucilaginibacter daejeonensis]
MANRDHDTSITAFTLTVADLGGNPTTYTGHIQIDGTFKIAFEQFIAQDITLTPIVKKMITHPGDSIHIDLDLKEMGNAKFSGDAEKLNADLFHYANEYYSTSNTDMDTIKVRDGDLPALGSYCLNMRTALQNNREEFIEKFDPDEELLAWTKNFINAQYYYKYAWYTVVAKTYRPGVSPLEKLENLSGFEQDIKDLFNQKLLCADAYNVLPFLAPAMDKKLIKGLSPEQRKQLYLVKIKKEVKNEELRELLIGLTFYYDLVENDADEFDRRRKTFDQNIKTPFIKQPLLRFYETVKYNTPTPEELSNSIKEQIKNTPAQGILDSIKTEHSGKVIYIDVWATWCGPCKAQMFASEKLAQKYKGKKVDFVYLCIGSKHGAWLSTLQQMKLSGSQYFCNDEQSESFMRGLGIKGIPYHLLINDKGQVVEMGNYLGPEDAVTMRKIDKLLKKGRLHVMQQIAS